MASKRSEEHTSELQSPFLISYAVFCLKKKRLRDELKRILDLDLPVDEWAKEEGIADEELLSRIERRADEHMAAKVVFFLMIGRPQRYKQGRPLFPYTTLFR